MTDGSYMWDRTGAADPELQRWERELAPFRRRHGPRRVPVRYAVAAAVIILAAAAAWFMRVPDDAVIITSLEGELLIDGKPASKGARVREGQRVETGRGGHVVVRAGSLGHVELVDRAALVLTSAREGRIRVRMESGDLRARIAAAPYAFRVETPGAVADDMGCAYQIVTDSAGNGWLRVTEGWVRLRSRGIDSLVVEGTEAALRTETGPGIPFREGAGPALRSLAGTITAGSVPDAGELALALQQARPEDTVTLLNLLWRAPLPVAQPIFTRLAAQYPPPDTVVWQRFQNRDLTAVAEWWPRLGFRKTVKLPPAFYPN